MAIKKTKKIKRCKGGKCGICEEEEYVDLGKRVMLD